MIQNHRITIWPGYKTTIDRHETDHLLLAEIIHKFLRQDTALNVMDKLRQAGLHDIEVKLFKNCFQVRIVNFILIRTALKLSWLVKLS